MRLACELAACWQKLISAWRGLQRRQAFYQDCASSAVGEALPCGIYKRGLTSRENCLDDA